MGSLSEFAKQSVIERQDKGENIDFKYIQRLVCYPHKYFITWVKQIGETIEVEMTHGINSYVCIFKLAKKDTYSFQYLYRSPASWQMIDYATTHLPIYNTYEHEANCEPDAYVLKHEVIAMAERAMKYAKYNIQKTT